MLYLADSSFLNKKVLVHMNENAVCRLLILNIKNVPIHSLWGCIDILISIYMYISSGVAI